jgi:hypothetical protein
LIVFGEGMMDKIRRGEERVGRKVLELGKKQTRGHRNSPFFHHMEESGFSLDIVGEFL